MSFTVQWEPSGEAALKRLPSWKEAARVSRAVLDLATTGVGTIERGTGTFRLIVTPYVVGFTIDPSAQTLLVWSVYERNK